MTILKIPQYQLVTPKGDLIEPHIEEADEYRCGELSQNINTEPEEDG